MVDLKQLRRITIEELNTRTAIICLKRRDDWTEDERLEFALIGRVIRSKHVEAINY